MVQVTLLDTMELATFCVRTFSLHKVNPFAVLHLHPLTHCSVAVRNTHARFYLLNAPFRTAASLSTTFHGCDVHVDKRRRDLPAPYDAFKVGQPPRVRR